MKNRQSMVFHLLIVLSLFLVCGCQKADPVGVTTKAKMVEELISDKKGCDAFKKQLTAPALSAPSIEAIYKNAIQAGCVYKDV